MWLASAVALALVILVAALAGVRRRSASHEETLTLEPQAFAATLAVAGTIVPAATLDVTAPAEGAVRAMSFDYGSEVRQGQVLLTLGASDLAQRRAEAMAGYLEASRNAADMADWARGPEVGEARRAVDEGAMELRSTQARAAATKALLDQGLVARDEYDELVQQTRSERLALQSAQDELKATLRRGEGAPRAEAQIQLAAARARLADADQQLAGATVRAPTSGIIVRPPADKGGEGPPVHVGAQISKGQLIGSIAAPGGLGVAFQVAEPDADQVRPGETVTVTGPGFPGLELHGEVVSVAGEAAPPTAAGGPLASFPALARLETPQADGAVRIGMTANVVVDTYRNPAALVVPADAIQGSAPSAFVMVKRGHGRPQARAVTIGHVAPDGVEILSGLKAGDVVVWTPPPPANDQD
ncbi:MAG TPA: HlyD family efflux transporter periplasmic adaptor subunit [Caulobacteraceae bacterium]|nr:HlyD family efflux transporter periplasmic adaptor subunit [Caulobacteraceae bacterium]